MKRTLLTIALFLVGILHVYAPPPVWWSGSGTEIIDSQSDEDNYAPANLGQLKHVAKQAKAYLDATLPGGAGESITLLVESFEPRANQGYTQSEIDDFIADNYSPINLGQLKAIAKPFYDRLLQVGYDTKANLIAKGYPGNWANDYPWDSQTPVSENYAPANLGQLKLVFSFDLLDDRDDPANGLPDWWERHYFSQTGINPDAPAERGDGLTNLQAYQQGKNPVDYYDGEAPVLVIHGGNNQSGPPEQFLTQALSVEVRQEPGGAPLINAPVSFTVTGGGGGVSAQTGGMASGTLGVRTDHEGIARVWFQTGNQGGAGSAVTAQAGTATPVEFTLSTEDDPEVAPSVRWPLDETEGTVAGDYSGNGRDATLLGNLEPRYGLGIRDYATAFNGTDTILEAENTGYDLIPENGRFTLSFWVRPDEIAGPNESLIALVSNDTGEGDGFRLAVVSHGNGEGHLRLWSSQSGGDIAMNSNQPVVAGSWYHVVITYNGSRADLYLNGAHEAGATGTIHANSRPLSFGGGIAGTSKLKGLLDEVVLHPKALSGTKVQSAYRHDAPLPRLTTSVLTAWVNVPISFPLTFSNSPGSVTSAGVPSGLTFDGGTLVIGGTPTVAGIYSVIFEAENSYGSASSVLTMIVSEELPQAPVINSVLSGTASAGATFAYRITAENHPASYGAAPLPQGLSLDASTGIITGTPSQSGTFSITLSATNPTGTDTAELILQIHAATGAVPVITSPTSASAQVGTPFTYTIIASHSPVSYAAEGLPDGLSINEETGVISGTPTMGNPVDAFVVRAINANGSASQVVQLTIAEGESSITSPLAVNAVVNESFVYELQASNHPTGFLASGLPSWLTFDAVNGLLSGIPPEPTPPDTIPYDVVIPVAAANLVEPEPQTVALTITVLGPRPTITSATRESATVGESFSYQISATGNPTSFSAESLPAGLSLNSATGLISGVPTLSGEYLVRLGATNASGEGDILFLRLEVLEPSAPEITSARKIYVVQNEPLAYEIEATGSPTSYNATNLPAGLTFNPGTHTISGAITQVGTPEMDLSATNAMGTGAAKLKVVVLSDSSTVTAILRLQSGVNPRETYRSSSAGISYDANDPDVALRSEFGGMIGVSEEEIASRTLIGFDISDLPADAEISSAALTLTGWSPSSAQVELHQTDPFDPETACWDDNATYDQTSLGGLSVDSLTMAPRVWSSTPEFVDAVEDAFSGREPLYLMLVSPLAEEADSEELPQQLFVNLEEAISSNRPLLEIGYTTAAPPEIEEADGISGVNGTAFEFQVRALHAPTLFQASGLPSGLTIDASTGVISGTPSVHGSFPVLLTVSNANGAATGVLPLTIHPSAPQITSALTATIPAKDSFSYTIVATNDPTRYAASALPSGLAIDPLSGVISGSVANAGTYHITIKAANGGGETTATLVLTVETIPPEITSSLTASGNVGASFNYSISASNGATSYSATGLPPGLSISGRFISGTPTQEGVYSVSIGAFNTAGSDSASLEITIGPLLVPVVTGASLNAALGTSFSYYMEISNFPTSYELTGLPPGITRSGRSLFGTPTQAGVFTVEVTATNAYGSGSGVIEIIVSEGPVITSSSSATGIQGSSFSYTVQTMGYGGVTVSASGLPPGLTSQGTYISGTPAQLGTYPVALSVSNAYGTSEFTLTIVIHSRPVITSGNTIDAQVGEPLSYHLTADHDPTSWDIVGLPAGLQLDSLTGEITGTPTIAGQVLANVTVQNAFGTKQDTLVFNVAAAGSDLKIDFQQEVSPTVVYTVSTAAIANDTEDPAVGQQGAADEPLAWVGRTSASTVERMLIAFDLTLLPQEATVTAAELGLFLPTDDFQADNLEIRLYEAFPFEGENPNWIDHSARKNAELGRVSLASGGASVIHGMAALAQAIQTARASENPVLYLMLLAPAAESGLSASGSIVAHGEDPAHNPRLTISYTASPPSEAPEITSPLVVAVTVGEAMTYGITATNRPTQYAASGLPDGLTIDPQTGVISGEPEEIGEFPVTLGATNLVGTGEAVLRLRVESLARTDQLTIVSGDRQSGPVGEFLSAPLVVCALRQGVPLEETLVTFSVREGDGEVALDDDSAPPSHRVSVLTDENGLAGVFFKTPGSVKTIEVTAESGNADPVKFQISSTADSGEGDQITLRVVSGNAQVTAQGNALPNPVILEVTDESGLPMPGVAMSYEMIQGSGQLSGDSVTGSNGRASLSVTLSGQPGTIHRIRATASGQAQATVVATTASAGGGGGNPGGNPDGDPGGGDPPGETPMPGGSGTRTMDASAMLSVSNLVAQAYSEYDNGGYLEVFDPTRAVLSWDNASIGGQGITIDRRTSTTGWMRIATVGSGVTSYTDNGLKADRRYFYRVRAYRGNESSAPAETAYRVLLIKALEKRYRYASEGKGSVGWQEYIESGDTQRYYLKRVVESSETTYKSTAIRKPVFNSQTGRLDFEIAYYGDSSYFNLGSLVRTEPTSMIYENGSITLSDEYTTDHLIADTETFALSDVGDWVSYDYIDYNHDPFYNPIEEDWWYKIWDMYWDYYGYPENAFISLRDIEYYESSYYLTIGQYRFQFFDSFDGKINLLEIFSPENDPFTTKDESDDIVVHKKRAISFGNSSSEDFTIDPRERGEDGTYYIVPVVDLNINDEKGAEIDERERQQGIPIEKDSEGESSVTFSFSVTDLPKTTYTISWTNFSKFRVYAFTYYAGWVEIQSGQQGNASTFFQLGNSTFKIVAVDSLNGQARTTLTLTTTANDQLLHTSTADFVYEPPTASLAMPLDEASGARYRKIGLTGIPLPDDKPQQAEESGQEPEETFIDALTLGLRHSTTDIYLPIPGSDFALSARRDYQSEVWSLRNGLRPQEDPTKPFGVGWSSNLVPHVKIVSNVDEPTKAYVTDESGAVHSFVVWYEPGNSRPKFFPMPTAKHQQAPNLSSLEIVSSASKTNYIFKRKYGSTLTFESAGSQSFPANRFNATGSGTSYTYARLKTGVDRLGYTLLFSYENATNLIPKTISVKDHPDLKISILQDAGLITKIWDAKGYATTFEYESETYTNTLNVSPVKKLARVIHPDGSVTKYTYVFTEEISPEPLPPDSPQTKYWHCDLASITDPLNNTYQFDYNGGSPTPVFDRSKLDYKSDEFFTGYFPQSGLPRNIRKIILPNGAESEFFNDSSVWIARDTSGALQAQGQRRNRVTDVLGLTRTYEFSDAKVIPLPEITSAGYAVNRNFREPKIAVYQQMTLAHGTQGTETFEFDIDAAMALKRVTDLSGNTTTFAYEDTWNAPADFLHILNTDAYRYHSDPTRQTNALGSVKSFTYTPESRLMKTITDEAGRTTTYVFDSRGRRTQETISGDGVTQVTKFTYGNTAHPGFITRKVVEKQAGDSSPTTSLVTESIPDANGNLASETIAPGSLNLTTRHTYDANGNRKTTTDPRGNTTTFSYDQRNRLTAISYPDGGTKYLVYDARGNKIKEYDENGHVTLMDYDEMNRVTQQVRDLNGNGENDGRGTDLVTSYTYNNAGARLSETDPRGNATTYQYDSLQRRTRVKDTEGNTTTFEYGTNSGGSVFESTGFKPTRSVAPRGVVTTITYDNLYRPVLATVTAPNTATLTTALQYDAVGNPVIATDSLNRQTRTTYDGLNRPTRVTYADGTYTETSYSTTGLNWKIRDELGRETVTEYDAAGRATLVRQPAVDPGDGTPVHPETRTIYDAAGNILAVINPLGNRWDYSYDVRNRKVRETQPGVYDFDTDETRRPTFTTRYDAVGNVIAATDALGGTVDTEYDAANRPTDVYAPEVAVAGGNPSRPHTATTYDANGNILSVTDPNGHTTTNTYDKLNRLLSTTDAAGITVRNQYDAAGNRTVVIDGMGHQTRFEYDGHNRNTKVIDPAGEATTYQYNALHKTQRTDALGQVTTYTYDLRDRLKNVIYANAPPSSPIRAHTYDAVGNLLTVSEAGKSGKADVSYTYDALNRQITETSGGLTHQYRYGLAGDRLKTTYGGSGLEIVSTYDALNRLSTMTEGGRTTTYRYDRNGKTRQKELPGATITETTYDALGRIQTILEKVGVNDLSVTLNEYDLASNVKTVEEQYSQGTLPDRTVRNTYDDANRLIEEAIDLESDATADITTSYVYDAGNNRRQKTVVGGNNAGVTDYRINHLNQIVAIDGPDGIVAYTYDANGNRLTRSKGGQTDTYAYDFENRLVTLEKATSGASGVYNYLYDYRTRRVERDECQAGGNTTRVIFSGGLSCFEEEGGNRIVEYIRGSDYGGGVGGILYTLRSNVPSYNHYNNRGDVVAKSDGVGAITYEAQYEAFGTRTSESGSTSDRQKANTKDEDPTGLLNEGFRYRDMETGTFITRDPLGFVDGPNLYAYVQQNPWTKFDPLGLESAQEKKWKDMASDDGVNIGMRFVAMGMAVAESLNPFRSDSSIRQGGRDMQKGFAESREILKRDAPPGIRELAQFTMGVASAGTVMMTGPAGVGELGDSLQRQGVVRTGKQMVAGLVDHAVNNPVEFAGEMTVAIAAGNAVKPGGLSAKDVTVTSWADNGLTPDLNPGRWVMKGGKTPFNFLMSGLPGPKVYLSKKFPFVKIEPSKVDYNNSITGKVPASSLEHPKGIDKLKPGQRKIKETGSE